MDTPRSPACHVYSLDVGYSIQIGEPILSEHSKTTPSDEGGPVDASSVETDVYCIRCGYNLRGLQRNSCCPECALPVADSLRGDLLADAAPDWLARVSRGASLISYGAILLIGSFVAFILLTVAFLFAAVFSPVVFVLVPLTVVVLPVSLLLIVVGSWRFTELEPRRVMIERRHSLRAATRAAAVAVFAVALIGLAAGTILGRSGVPTAVVSGVNQATIWFGGAGAVALVILLGYRVAELAERLPDMKLAQTARRRAPALGACVALAVLMNAVDSAPSAFLASGVARWISLAKSLLYLAAVLYAVGTLACASRLGNRLRSIVKGRGTERTTR